MQRICFNVNPIFWHKGENIGIEGTLKAGVKIYIEL